MVHQLYIHRSELICFLYHSSWYGVLSLCGYGIVSVREVYDASPFLSRETKKYGSIWTIIPFGKGKYDKYRRVYIVCMGLLIVKVIQ